MCSKPFRPSGNVEFGCGQCMPCRINRLRLWQGRLLLESTQHPTSLFVTLTYDDQHLPQNSWLKPVDLQRYMKSLRKVHESKIRFFAVGEYGDISWRPHYHLALFGDFAVSHDRGRIVVPVVSNSWKKGHTHIGLITPESAGYMTRYTLKRMAQSGNPLLEGRTPEFTRMSLKPGIGRLALNDISEKLMERKGAAFLSAKGDVPEEFITHGRRYRLGRYLANGLREEVGRQPGTPSNIQLARSAERLTENKSVRELKRQQHENIAKARVRKFKSKEVL